MFSTPAAKEIHLKVLLIGIFSLASFSYGQMTRTCSDSPQGLPSFNPDWYYSEFAVPENFQIISLYGGFERPGYTPAHQDYIAQFYRPGQTISSLDDFQLFNYDMIDDPLYNREFNIENLNVIGQGTLRFSVPITHGVIWNEACVSIAPASAPESVPEPSTFAFLVIGGAGLLFTRQKLNQSRV
jgi:hypothetical protein